MCWNTKDCDPDYPLKQRGTSEWDANGMGYEANIHNTYTRTLERRPRTPHTDPTHTHTHTLMRAASGVWSSRRPPLAERLNDRFNLIELSSNILMYIILSDWEVGGTFISSFQSVLRGGWMAVCQVWVVISRNVFLKIIINPNPNPNPNPKNIYAEIRNKHADQKSKIKNQKSKIKK